MKSLGKCWHLLVHAQLLLHGLAALMLVVHTAESLYLVLAQLHLRTRQGSWHVMLAGSSECQ
jgi:hypothetical protein